MNSRLSSAFDRILANAPDEMHDALVLAVPEIEGAPASAPDPAVLEKRAKRSSALLDELAKSAPGASSGTRTAKPFAGGTVSFLSVRARREQLEAYSGYKNVLGVVPNQRVFPLEPLGRGRRRGSARRDEPAALTWGLECLEAQRLWEITRGAGVRVGVIDTGVYADHPALKDRVERFAAFDPQNRRVAVNPAFDTSDHGTHVCGTIAGGMDFAGRAFGIAPEAKLCVACITLGEPRLDTLLCAIEWLVQRNCSVINLSVGLPTYDHVVAEVFQRLLGLGVVTVAASGNNSLGSVHFPASAPSAFSVGAAERGSSVRGTDVTPSSSGATLTLEGGLHLVKPDVVAPGRDIHACVPPYREEDAATAYDAMDGTSMAAALASGSIALLRAAKKKAPASALLEALRATATHPGTEQRPDNRWGYGLIHPREALAQL